MTTWLCNRCRRENRAAADYCGRCGLSRAASSSPPGRAPHPSPVAAPEGFRRCNEAADLWFRPECSWGGVSLSGTESIVLLIHNAGYPLRRLRLRITARAADGGCAFDIERDLDDLPRGTQVRIEVPSYEITAPADDVGLTLLTAEFAVNEPIGVLLTGDQTC